MAEAQTIAFLSPMPAEQVLTPLLAVGDAHQSLKLFNDIIAESATRMLADGDVRRDPNRVEQTVGRIVLLSHLAERELGRLAAAADAIESATDGHYRSARA